MTDPMNMHQVDKPKERGKLRKTLGKEFYILKRKWRWIMRRAEYAGEFDRNGCEYTCISHKSMLLRPLKDVDMVLQNNKVTNLRLAIAHLDGLVIRPGKKMSIWKLVGRPSKRKGYLDGLVLHNGRILKGTGGGLCQLGNLLYWMVLHTDLDITERWRHSYDVFPDINRTIPFGCGATLAYNYIDLEVTNSTDAVYSIHLWLDDEFLHGEVRCSRKPSSTFEVYESDHVIKQQWWGGFTRHNRIWKRKTGPEGVTEEKLVAENHAIMMYNPLLPGKT